MEPNRASQRPTGHPRQAATPVSTQQPAPSPAASVRKKQRGSDKKLAMLALAALVVLALGYGALSWLRIVGPMAGVKPDKYQAVFLANDQAQVYFGKIAAITPDTIILHDVYYIKSQNQSAEQSKEESQQSQAVLTRIDSNNELHSPYDEMRINRDQVLFWENLKDDSKIVKTIKSDNKQ